jgi:hypothetical protein
MDSSHSGNHHSSNPAARTVTQSTEAPVALIISATFCAALTIFA